MLQMKVLAVNEPARIRVHSCCQSLDPFDADSFHIRIVDAVRAVCISTEVIQLVPIVRRPEDARPDPELLRLLDALSAAPGLEAVVLSGRPVALLDKWLPRDSLTLVGTHGAEWRPSGGSPGPLLAPPEARRAFRTAARLLSTAFESLPGAQVEPKDYGVAVHYRRVGERDLPGALQRHGSRGTRSVACA